jgi:hypothetical protein
MSLLDAIRASDREALDALLADEVVFNSPVRTYRDRDEVIHLLSLIGGVLDDVRVTRTEGAATFIAGRAASHEIDGVLAETRENDTVTELTLMLRPLDATLKAVEKMGRAIAAAPSPSP